MLTLLLCSYLIFASDGEEIAACRFLDEFYDFQFSYSEQQDTPEDILQQPTPPNTPMPDDQYDPLLWRDLWSDIRT